MQTMFNIVNSRNHLGNLQNLSSGCLLTGGRVDSSTGDHVGSNGTLKTQNQNRQSNKNAATTYSKGCGSALAEIHCMHSNFKPNTDCNCNDNLLLKSQLVTCDK